MSEEDYREEYQEAQKKAREEACCCGHDHSEGCCGGHEHGKECCGGHEHDHGDDCCCGGHGDKTEKDSDPYETYEDKPLGKPNLISIVTTIAQQAMVSMGVLPNPISGKTIFLLNQATYLIESIDVLIEKTKGNCTDEESRIIENVAHELRMLFVAASKEKARRQS